MTKAVANTATTGISVAEAQRDMRFAYFGGAPGILTSGTVWLIASVVSVARSVQLGIWVLFIGGVFIHPVSVLLTRALGRPGKHASGNPLGALAMEGTIWMIFALALAYGVSLLRVDLFFPAMLLVIGGRYLTFSTIYGNRLYWVFGATLALASYALASTGAPPVAGGFAGAAIEAVFAIAVFIVARRETA